MNPMKTLNSLHSLSICLLTLLLALSASGCATMRAVIDPPSDPLTTEEHLDLGLAYESEGRLKQAVRQYDLAAKEIPEALVLKGNALFAQGKLKQAADSFEAAVEEQDDNAEARNNLAWTLYMMNEELERAEKLAVRALELAGPTNREAYEDTLIRIRAKRAGKD
jgi:tetratricopeptide (TPR) repeat protein